MKINKEEFESVKQILPVTDRKKVGVALNHTNHFTFSTSIKKIGDSVVLFKDDYVKRSYLYNDPNCEVRANNSGFTCEDIGVVLEDHFDMNGIPRSHKIMVNNGNTGWIPVLFPNGVYELSSDYAHESFQLLSRNQHKVCNE